MAGAKRPGAAVRTLLTVAGVAIAGVSVAMVTGCGNQYRPVVNPVVPTGPAPAPAAYISVVSNPAETSTATSGIATILDFSGDSVMAQAQIGNGPLGFGLDSAGANDYNINADGTLDIFPVSTSLQTKNVAHSTLPQGVNPINLFLSSNGLYVIEQTPNVVSILTGSPPGLTQDISVPAGLVTLAGRASSQRVYAISQQTEGTSDCNDPSSVTATGVVTAIETGTKTVSATLPVGICPVYGIASADNARTFILNRGSNSITVIDSLKNVLNPAHTTIPVGGGPVYADFYDKTSQLVTANYDGDSISVIDVTLNNAAQPDTDAPQFGTVHTVQLPAGSKPTMVTVLQDGSRAYVANSGNHTISVVDLSAYVVKSTIPFTATTTSGAIATPRQIFSILNTPYAKVYVGAPDSEQVTVIRTDTDTVYDLIPVLGNVVDLRPNREDASAGSQPDTVTYTSGSGVPCVLGPSSCAH